MCKNASEPGWTARAGYQHVKKTSQVSRFAGFQHHSSERRLPPPRIVRIAMLGCGIHDVTPWLSIGFAQGREPPVESVWELYFLLLFDYSCPTFPLLRTPSLPPTPIVNPHPIVSAHGSFIHVP